MQKIMTTAGTIILGLLMSSGVAFAASNTIGNDANTRGTNDTYHNFVVVDTNNPASMNGVITQFKYYATNNNPFQFIVVDGSKKVKYESPVITPSGTVPGAQTYTPASPVTVQTGWNIGMYFNQASGQPATIPFDFGGANAYYTADNSGLPALGSTITPAGTSSRTYSFVATVTTPAKYSVKPWVYDPDHTNTAFSRWLKNLGLKDQQGNDMYGLLLSKNATTPTNSAAGASLKGVKNITLSELGFDIRHTDPNYGSHCGAGAPRFNVVTNQHPDVVYFFGCTSGTKTTATPQQGWTRVRFDPATGLPNGGTPGSDASHPALSATDTVKTIDIVFDEGNDSTPEDFGLAELDNIDVNGTIVGQPGMIDQSHNDQDDYPDNQNQYQKMNVNK